MWHDWILTVTLLGVLIIIIYVSCFLLIVRKRGKTVYGYLNFVFQHKALNVCSSLNQSLPKVILGGMGHILILML